MVFIVNYYDLICEEQLISLKSRYGNIIVDNTQAFYARPVKGLDTVYSCRNFFGVPDGGYVYTEAEFQEYIPEDVSMERIKHVLGCFDGNSALDYYEYFNQNDESFEEIELRRMSKLTHNILGAIDYQEVKRRREVNFYFFRERWEKEIC